MLNKKVWKFKKEDWLPIYDWFFFYSVWINCSSNKISVKNILKHVKKKVKNGALLSCWMQEQDDK